MELPRGCRVSESNTVAPGLPGYTIVHEDTGMEFVWMPPGEFEMGSGSGNPDAGPVHSVRITHGLWVGKYEVTNAQFERFCKAKRSPMPEASDLGSDHPVVGVTWFQATEFSEHYGMRLPTEAEWEYAARGPESRPLPWGPSWERGRACASDNRGEQGRTFPVGSLCSGVSWCGAMDMVGNVFEWCSDWHVNRLYPGLPREQRPPNAMVGARVIRGGAYTTPTEAFVRCTARSDMLPRSRHPNIGFRCARTA